MLIRVKAQGRIIPALQWREMSTDEILRSLSIGLSVLEDRAREGRLSSNDIAETIEILSLAEHRLIRGLLKRPLGS